MNWDKKEILITGGTGSLGKTLVKLLIKKYNPKGIRIYSRDELKQWKLKQELNTNIPISYLIGDVRDLKRLCIAMDGVDIVIHAAAMKQVPTCEDNPTEAIETNINGSMNVLNASLKCKVKKVIGIITDKAVYPINLYGMTKAVSEKIFIQGNTYSKHYNDIKRPMFSCCRYGNVIGSRGSIVPLFKEQKKKGMITITHKDMTRFWVTLPRIADFILQCIEQMQGEEIFIPEMPSMSVMDIAKTIAPNTEIKYIGIREGEKLHEDLWTKEECEYIWQMNRLDKDEFKERIGWMIIKDKKDIHLIDALTSVNNPNYLTKEKLLNMINEEI